MVRQATPEEMLARVQKSALELDQRRIEQIANQIAAMNRLLDIILQIRKIVVPPLDDATLARSNVDRERRYDQICELVNAWMGSAGSPLLEFQAPHSQVKYCIGSAHPEDGGNGLVVRLQEIDE